MALGTSAQTLNSMNTSVDNGSLLRSMQRALRGEVHPTLRQVSVELDDIAHVVRIRFEHDGQPSEQARVTSSCAATEVIADFPSPWQVDEQHVVVARQNRLNPLSLIAFRRWESESAVAVQPLALVDGFAAR